ncbi:MAG: 4'-phosphopantetheinyl transferase superfamily protein [Mariniphaga sp.]|nr:4'-phosphopantetheinyl transferase superfamily protein [Mariniphaga sp.]
MKWENSVNLPYLNKNEDAMVIIYGTDFHINSPTFPEILTHEELIYSEKFKNGGHKISWLSCRATLRLILGNYLNKNPTEVELKKGRFGKLYLPATDLFFNVSHSNNAFLLGFSVGGRIGVDIELLDGSEDLSSMVSYAFSEVEAKSCNYGQKCERFTEIWTLKEAFLKAIGIGLVDKLTAITVIECEQNEIMRLKLNQKSFICPNGETASIVYRKNKTVKFIWLK